MRVLAAAAIFVAGDSCSSHLQIARQRCKLVGLLAVQVAACKVISVGARAGGMMWSVGDCFAVTPCLLLAGCNIRGVRIHERSTKGHPSTLIISVHTACRAVHSHALF